MEKLFSGGFLMKKFKKLAVFDLDGTLWKENSHVEICNAYYKTKFFSSLVYRGISHFFRSKMNSFLWKCYSKVPKDFAFNFELPFNQEILTLLKQKQNEGFMCLIVSNAPYEIVFHAAQRLNLPFLRCPQFQKKKTLDENYEYSNLFVCTDNVEDFDLVKAADERKIIFTKYNTKFFNSEGFYD